MLKYSDLSKKESILVDMALKSCNGVSDFYPEHVEEFYQNFYDDPFYVVEDWSKASRNFKAKLESLVTEHIMFLEKKNGIVHYKVRQGWFNKMKDLGEF